jgi:hypothetical protein
MASTSGSGILVDSQWHHVAVVVNRDNAGGNPSAIYVDAANVTGADTLENTPSSLNPVGDAFWLWGRALTGRGDDFAIFKQALSRAQIASLSGFTTTTSSTSSTTLTSIIQDFESWPQTANWGSTTHDGWMLSDGQVKQNRGGFGPPMDVQCGWLHDFDDSTNSWIQSPSFAGGVVSVSFWTRQDVISGGSSFAVLQRSSNASDWIDFDSFTVSTNGWAQRMHSVNTTIPTYLRIRKTGDTASDTYTGIDNISVLVNATGSTTTVSSSSSSTSTTATTSTTTSNTTTSSTTLAQPEIMNMSTDVMLWTVYTTTGAIAPVYSTNLGTLPVEWMSVSVFSNSFISGTNLFTFDPPDTNAQSVFFQMWYSN